MGTVTYKKSGQHPCMKYGDQKSASYAPGSAAPEYQQVGSAGTFTKPSKDSGNTFSRAGASPEISQVTAPGGKMKSGKTMPRKGDVNPHNKSEDKYSADYNPYTTGSGKQRPA